MTRPTILDRDDVAVVPVPIAWRWKKSDNDGWVTAWQEVREYVTELERRLADVELAHKEATRLAISIHASHYFDDAPDWKPLDDIRGVVSQIDNMTTGLERTGTAEARIAALERHVEELQDKIDPETDCACSYDEPGTVCDAHSPHVRELERQLASCEADRIERIEQCNRMANDWSEFCASIGVTWDPQEYVAREVNVRIAALELRLAEAERVIKPFVRLACIEEEAADGSSTVININLLRAARAWKEGK